MEAYSSSGHVYGEGFNRGLEDFMRRAEVEVRHAVAYVDSVVIPEVRRETGGALRLLAVHLERYAGKLDPASKRDGNSGL